MQKTWKRVQPYFKSDYLWWGIILIGIVLRLRQYLLNRSLWADEASLAMNLVTRNFGELTQLLDYHQAAPIGFLFIEKLSIIGSSGVCESVWRYLFSFRAHVRHTGSFYS